MVDKMSRKMSRWQNVMLTKCHADKMSCWQNVMLTKCHVYKIPCWQNGMMVERHVGKIARLLNCKLMSWQNGDLTKWKVDEMTNRPCTAFRQLNKNTILKNMYKDSYKWKHCRYHIKPNDIGLYDTHHNKSKDNGVLFFTVLLGVIPLNAEYRGPQ